MSKLGRKRIVGSSEGWMSSFTVTPKEVYAEATKLHLRNARFEAEHERAIARVRELVEAKSAALAASKARGTGGEK